MRRLCLLLALLLALLLPFSANSAELRVAVASNFLSTLQALQPLFAGATGHTLLISSGSTGKLYAQISHGAPFDVFLAADSARPERLEQDGLAVPGSRMTYARGQLSLWSNHPGLRGQDCLAALKGGAYKRLAIANPVTAPYGAAAQQTLQHLGLWDTHEARLVRGENIGQTLQFVNSGNAELGFVARAQVVDSRLGAGSCRWDVPDDHHQPLYQQGVILKAAAGLPAARAFMEFLRGPRAQALIAAQGYGVD